MKTRMTLYITTEQLDLAERLRTAFKEENEYYPDISKSSWFNLILNRGLDALRADCAIVQET